jgi:hypothetical protein
MINTYNVQNGYPCKVRSVACLPRILVSIFDRNFLQHVSQICANEIKMNGFVALSSLEKWGAAFYDEMLGLVFEGNVKYPLVQPRQGGRSLHCDADGKESGQEGGYRRGELRAEGLSSDMHTSCGIIRRYFYVFLALDRSLYIHILGWVKLESCLSPKANRKASSRSRKTYHETDELEAAAKAASVELACRASKIFASMGVPPHVASGEVFNTSAPVSRLRKLRPGVTAS